MRKLTFAVLGVSLAVFGIAACSDDDDSGGAAGSSAAGSGGSAGSAGGAGVAGSAGTAGSAGSGVSNQCTSTSDQAAVAGTYGDGGTIVDLAAACGKGCLNDADKKACTTKCVVEGTGNAVSEGCASCFSASVMCTIDVCLADCIADATAPACTECRCGQKSGQTRNCVQEYVDCSGIPSTSCEAPADAAAD